jgi:hypothetical protein
VEKPAESGCFPKPQRKEFELKKKARKKGNTGKRYSEAQRKKIIAYAEGIGRGGISAACRKFGVSYIALRRWMKNGTAGKRGRAGRPAKAGLDGRKLRGLRNAAAAAKTLKQQISKIQRLLKQLSK